MFRISKIEIPFCLLMLVGSAAMAQGQTTSDGAPEPIYWRQNLLTVPYQWSSSAGDQSSKAVWLYVSRDRGASWHLVADGESHLLSFNYRAEADGEYWFAVRTTESSNVNMPSSLTSVAALRPELKVIVDTTVPRLESLTAQLSNTDALEVRWRIVDANLGTQSCTVEAQDGPDGDWQPVPLRSESQVSAGVWEGAASLVLTPGQLPTTVRAAVADLANNRTRYQTPVGENGGPEIQAGGSGSQDSRVARGGIPFAPPIIANQIAAAAKPQPWPADRSGWMPFGGAPEDPAAVAYGTPIGVGPRNDLAVKSEHNLQIPEPTTEDRPLGNVPPQHDSLAAQSELFHLASTSRGRPATGAARSSAGFDVPPPPVNPLARRVNSRSLALEYELADVGELGVSKVEVWGTHDGGQTWQSVATDDDNRSPVEVTVDGEGEYGFTIVAAGPGPERSTSPQTGDTPTLWIEVDLEPPIARILSVNAARGRAGGELTVTWEAEDEHLDPRPIALYYSSRPAGPWTPIATSIENFGEFTWPIERHVPQSVFLKLEARDAAGNVAAFQTAEPVVTESAPAVASWQRLPPVE